MTYPDYLKKIEPNDYNIKEDTFWLLMSTFGNSIKDIIKGNNGILNKNKFIEKIAESSKLFWNLKRVKRGYILTCGDYELLDKKHKTIEKYTSLECMRKYSLEWMENATERSYHFIDLQFERDYKLNLILNESSL